MLCTSCDKCRMAPRATYRWQVLPFEGGKPQRHLQMASSAMWRWQTIKATSSAIGPATAIEWSNDRRAKSSRCSKRQPMSSPLSFSLCLFNKHIGCRFSLLIFSIPRMNVCYDLMFSFLTKLRWRNQRCYFFPPSFHQTKKKKIGLVSTAQGRVRGQADVNTF